MTMRGPLADRVRSRAGSRWNASVDELIVLAGINDDDSDTQISAKLDRVATKYPDMRRTPDDFLAGLEQDAKARNTRGLKKLGIG